MIARSGTITRSGLIGLVFDFGLKHIGVAVALGDQDLARGIVTVDARDGQPLWPSLDAVLREWRPTALVVGDPLNMDGTASSMGCRARRFGRTIAERYDLPVHFVDERLSSFEANARGATGPNAHAIAAETIAETWLAMPR